MPPGFARSLMAPQVPGLEGDLAHGELLGVGLLGGIHLLHDVLLEAEEEGGLAGVVEAEEDDLGLLVHQPQTLQGRLEPVHNPHSFYL